MNEQISPNDSGVPAPGPASAGPAVSVEIGELILDGFGPVDGRPVNSRRMDSGRPNSGRPNSGRPDSGRAAEAFRRELAREFADTMAGPAAEQLAGTIAEAVFRQLAAQQRGGPRPRGSAR
jgi:hypothetical protein